jgi:hypothetical protein
MPAPSEKLAQSLEILGKLHNSTGAAAIRARDLSRTAVRFLMNLMLASGGYPWTVIPVGARKTYMEALEKASVGEDIVPFTNFLTGLVKKGLAGEPLPAVPKTSSS